MKKSARGIRRDRLSELPDSIILDILSFLPIRDVIQTTFLSKRWRNLWTTVPYLNFTDLFAIDEKTNDKVRTFVNRVLLFWKGTKIMKLNFDFGYVIDGATLACDIDLWLHFAVDKNLEELSINLTNSMVEGEEDEEMPKYMAPQCLYSCSSITKLSLVGCNLINEFPTWYRLKSLKIDEFCYSEVLINRIIWCSPLLEELELRVTEREADLNIQSTSLKRLKICKYKDLYRDFCMRLRICCANLKTLEMSGILFGDYRLKNVSSLTDVTFKFSEFSALNMRPREQVLANLVSGLEHVERLTLPAWCYKELTESENLFTPLPNVKFLSLGVDDIEPLRLVEFLEYFPDLKMLVLDVHFLEQDYSFIDKPLEAEEGLSTSSLPQLRTVEIHAPIDSPTAFQFIVLLLNHFSMLQKLVIRAGEVVGYPSEFMYKAARLLVSLQRSFPTTQVILK